MIRFPINAKKLQGVSVVADWNLDHIRVPPALLEPLMEALDWIVAAQAEDPVTKALRDWKEATTKQPHPLYPPKREPNNGGGFEL